LREGLNTLDGFSTTASYFAAFSGKLDATKVKNSATAVDLIVVNLTNPTKPVKAAFAWVDAAGAITFTPTEPLDENTQYAVVLRSRGNDKPADAKEAFAAVGGLADATGRRVIASSAFALSRLTAPLVDKAGKSQVSVLDDATAARLEPVRLAYDGLLSALEKNPAIQPPLKREDVAILWTFTTQTITEPLTKLRALPYSILGTIDTNKPAFVGGIDPTLSSFPPDVPKDDIGGLGKGTFTSWNALDPKTGAFLVDPTKGKPEAIPFYITLPKLADCSATACTDTTATCATLLDTTQNPPVATAQKYCVPAKFPVVVVQHGLTRQKEDFFAIANTLAQGGYAVVAFDVIYHGERSVCATSADCVATATCSAAHKCCDKTTTTDCGAANFADLDKNGIPDVSGGAAFLNTANPFAIRDNLRQHVIDASAFFRAIRMGAAGSLQLPLIDLNNAGAPVPIALDPTNVNLLSHSLGSILSTMVLATDNSVKRAVLSVPGAPVVKIFATTPQPDFAAVIDGLL
ncbi:MAG: hypothetical protein KAI47_18280, partial [Deltaproteobacteria bacterium]|nr:hypothetical protein [Deltaproteobacteria bacterium]